MPGTAVSMAGLSEVVLTAVESAVSVAGFGRGAATVVPFAVRLGTPDPARAVAGALPELNRAVTGAELGVLPGSRPGAAACGGLTRRVGRVEWALDHRVFRVGSLGLDRRSRWWGTVGRLPRIGLRTSGRRIGMGLAEATPWPVNTAVPIPRATASPPTRPTYLPAPMAPFPPDGRSILTYSPSGMQSVIFSRQFPVHRTTP